MLENLNEILQTALQQPWTRIYAKLIALILFYGGLVHIGNIAGWGETPWLSTPLLWRVMDVILLCFNIITAIALWLAFTWSIWLLFTGMILFQFIPYTLMRSQFILKPDDAQTLNGLLITEIIILVIFAVLIWWKK